MGNSDFINGLNRNLSSITNNLSKSFNKLSSGKRINTAADDAAGLAIADSLKSNAVVYERASSNISDATSLISIADGALNSLGDISIRLQELSAQSANGTLSDDQRVALDQEFQQLTQEATRIVETTEFNGENVFSGTKTFQVGLDSSASSQINVQAANVGNSVTSLQSLSIGTVADARNAIENVSSFISDLSQNRGQVGAQESRLQYANSNALTQADNSRAAEARIRDVDIAEEVANKISNEIKQNTTTALIASANQNRGNVLKFLS